MRMGAGLAGSYIGYQLQRPFLSEEGAEGRHRALKLKHARNVREELQDLRGPVMKLGQALSMQTHFLGPEMIAELSALQMHAPPMHPTLMRAQFKSSLGKNPEELFQSFEPEPFAAASLGQVHWAVTKGGEKVAVKIQYPAMREAIESDFQALRTAGTAARWSGHLPDSVIQETRRGILEETDYANEARNIERFRSLLAPLKFVRVPTVHHDLSSGQVLTMSRIPGLRLNEFLNGKPSQALRDKLGAGLARLFFFQVFRGQVLHADPHPGNYLFRPDGSIGMLDFGCVKRFTLDWRELTRFYETRGWRESEAAARRFLKILCGPKAPYEKARKILPDIEEWMDACNRDGSGDFFFGRKMEPAREKRLQAAKARTARKIFQNKLIEPEFIFLSRADQGICFLLEQLGAVVNVSEISRRVDARQIISKAIAS